MADTYPLTWKVVKVLFELFPPSLLTTSIIQLKPRFSEDTKAFLYPYTCSHHSKFIEL